MSAGQAAMAARLADAFGPLDPDHPPVETIDEWFVRTARILLGQARRGEPAPRRKSPAEQRLAILEQAIAALKADNEQLSSEVVALRTLLYARDRES